MPLDQFHLIAIEQFKSIIIQYIHTVVSVISFAVKIKGFSCCSIILGNSK